MAAFLPFVSGFSGGLANAFANNQQSDMERQYLAMRQAEELRKMRGDTALQGLGAPPTAFGSTVQPGQSSAPPQQPPGPSQPPMFGQAPTPGSVPMPPSGHPAGQPSPMVGQPGGQPPVPQYVTLPTKPQTRTETTKSEFGDISGTFDSTVQNLEKTLGSSYGEVDKWMNDSMGSGAKASEVRKMAEDAKKTIREQYDRAMKIAEDRYGHGKDTIGATNTAQHQTVMENKSAQFNAGAHANPIWASEDRALKPITDTEMKIDQVLSLLNTGNPVSTPQIQNILNDVFDRQRLTNHIYEKNKSFGAVYERAGNTISRWALGHYSDVNAKMIKDLLNEMRTKVVEPARKNIIDVYRGRFKAVGADPSLADNPNPYTSEIPSPSANPGAEADAYLGGK